MTEIMILIWLFSKKKGFYQGVSIIPSLVMVTEIN